MWVVQVANGRGAARAVEDSPAGACMDWIDGVVLRALTSDWFSPLRRLRVKMAVHIAAWCLGYRTCGERKG